MSGAGGVEDENGNLAAEMGQSSQNVTEEDTVSDPEGKFWSSLNFFLTNI